MAGLAGTQTKVLKNVEITGITEDSREVKSGYCFVAVRGVKTDGHLFIPEAVRRGASVIVVEKNIQLPFSIPEDVLVIEVPNTQAALARLSQAFYNFPARDCTTIGVTGTTGKTTTTYLLESIFKAAGREVGVIGTINYRWGNKCIAAKHTTPPATELAQVLWQMRYKGNVNTLVMEVSSHSIAQYRIEGIRFDVGVFSNLSQDHLDFHKTMEEYKAVKWRFFSDYLQTNPQATGVFNIDDTTGREFYEHFMGDKLSYGIHNEQANLVARKWEFDINRMVIDVNLFGRRVVLTSKLIGEFNIYNILAAAGASWAAGISLEEIVKGVELLSGVPGRLERIECGQPFTVLVDYSHKPEAITQALLSVKRLNPRRIITVFGCGGDRDRQKRPLMSKAAAQYSDFIIITSDNPRSEDPALIAAEVEVGLLEINFPAERYRKILDRREAIFYAINLAQEQDLVIIMGKGHEDYQIIGDKIIHFDDREVAREAIAARMNVLCN